MAGDDVGDSVTSRDPEIKRTNKKKGTMSRLLSTIFGVDKVDFEKRLQHISKTEAAVLSRIRRRSQRRRTITRQLVMFSLLFEVIAVSYAIMTTRSKDLNWKIRALRVLPIFFLPALSTFAYSALGSYTRMRDRKDNESLEMLRSERQERINQLKEKTNYYATQQLIQVMRQDSVKLASGGVNWVGSYFNRFATQIVIGSGPDMGNGSELTPSLCGGGRRRRRNRRYDPDPASKAAAATVLASKLGSESGLKLYVGDEPNVNDPTGKSNDVDFARTTAPRNRKPPHLQISSTEIASPRHPGETLTPAMFEGADTFEQHQLVVQHHPQTGLSANEGGWIARIAALLVGEDPTQSYAVICRNCHMHNGLARKEDFPYITYYCPHCKALNRTKQPGEIASDPNSPSVASLTTMADAEVVASPVGTTFDTISPISSHAAAAASEGVPES